MLEKSAQKITIMNDFCRTFFFNRLKINNYYDIGINDYKFVAILKIKLLFIELFFYMWEKFSNI